MGKALSQHPTSISQPSQNDPQTGSMGTIFPVQILHQVLFPSIKDANEGNFPNPANHRSYLSITEFNVYHDATGIWSDWRGNDEFEKQKTFRPYHRRTGLHGFHPWLACCHYCLWISAQLMALLVIAFNDCDNQH